MIGEKISIRNCTCYKIQTKSETVSVVGCQGNVETTIQAAMIGFRSDNDECLVPLNSSVRQEVDFMLLNGKQRIEQNIFLGKICLDP